MSARAFKYSVATTVLFLAAFLVSLHVLKDLALGIISAIMIGSFSRCFYLMKPGQKDPSWLYRRLDCLAVATLMGAGFHALASEDLAVLGLGISKGMWAAVGAGGGYAVLALYFMLWEGGAIE